VLPRATYVPSPTSGTYMVLVLGFILLPTTTWSHQWYLVPIVGDAPPLHSGLKTRIRRTIPCRLILPRRQRFRLAVGPGRRQPVRDSKLWRRPLAPSVRASFPE
jgi:hypothetical protein